ncbi:MAG: DNA ligase D, partial [Flavisolibacter sp.]
KGVLKSWAVPKGPSMNPEEKRLAHLVEDHPFDYKDFEGIIPEGNYGAGTVIIWDNGTYAPKNATGDKEKDEKLLTKQFYSGKMSIVLKGKKVKGEFTLVRTPDRGENSWLLIKQNDRYAERDSEISRKDKSIISGKTIEEMASDVSAAKWISNRSSTSLTRKSRRSASKKSNKIIIEASVARKDYKNLIQIVKREFKDHKKTEMPLDLTPMLATRIKQPFNDPDWLFEIKWDGFRCLSYIKDGKAQLRSRSNLSFNKIYLPVTEALENWPVNAIVDGEIVVLNENGKPDFEAMQNFQNSPDSNIVYYVFDILWLDGINLMDTPLVKRKEILQKLIPDNSRIKFSDSIEEVGIGFFELAKKNELEGIIGKRKNSYYIPGRRTGDWLKMPTEIRQEFVIGGYTESDSGRPFRSLLFGYYENGKLINAGHAGGGFKEKQMKQILSRLQKLETKNKTFDNEVEADTKIHWVKPQLVAEIKYASVNSSGKIRKPAIFLGFREDKDPKEVVKEIDVIPPSKEKNENENKKTKSPSDSNWPLILNTKINNRSTFTFEDKEVELTNIDRKLWEEFTKADLLMYYHAVYPFIFPHLKERPLSLHIKPVSPTAPGFYIKDMEGHQPEWADIYSMERKHKKKGKRDQIDYLVCNNEATLQYIINLGCIDVNPWTSRISSPDNPDYVIIDLDPSDDDFSKVIESAKAAKQFFDQHKLKAFIKTSGKSGMHIVLPCFDLSFPEARAVAEFICSQVHALLPDNTTIDISVNNRGSKVYLDPNQNDFADTIASAYSVRPYKIPTISAPIEWKELTNKLDPSNFKTTQVLDRLKKKGDLWEDVLSEKIKRHNNKILRNFL